MKKVTALVLALVMVVAFCVPALAESTTELIFEYEDPAQNEPAFTVTVPALIELDAEDGVTAQIVAEDVLNIPDDQKISVTIAGTSYGEIDLRGDMILLNDENANLFQWYTITRSDGTVINGGQTITNQLGTEICSFTESGIEQIIFGVRFNSSAYGTYSGTLTYGIGLVDAD